MDKVKMTYKVVKGRNPNTGEIINVPVVTGKRSMSLRQLVAYAKSNGYVRGQLKDLEGLLNGFIEAMQDRAQAGFTVNINDWFIITGTLTGQVGEDHQLTAKNTYRVNIRTSKALKVGIENFSWSREDESALIKIESLSSPNSQKGEIMLGKCIVANGRNIRFNADNGDTASLTYTDPETGEPATISVVPEEFSEAYMRLPAFEDGDIGGEVRLTVCVHDDNGVLQTSSQTAKIVAGDTPLAPKILRAYSTTLDREGAWKVFNDVTVVTMKRDLPETFTATMRLIDNATDQEITRAKIEGRNRVTRKDAKTIELDLSENTTPESDGGWASASRHVEVIVETADGVATFPMIIG